MEVIVDSILIRGIKYLEFIKKKNHFAALATRQSAALRFDPRNAILKNPADSVPDCFNTGSPLPILLCDTLPDTMCKKK